MATCNVCSEPFAAHNSMRRGCCPQGVVHLTCIENLDLEQCRACHKDPMEGWEEMKQFRLCPFDPADLPPRPPQLAFLSCSYGQIEAPGEPLTVERNVECAYRSLHLWKEMIDSVISEMTFDWCEKIYVSGLEVCATFLNGNVLVEKNEILEHSKRTRSAIRDMISSSVWQSVARFAGLKEETFSQADIDCYKLDQIVELAIKFTCRQWTNRTDSAYDSQRPYRTVLSQELLGTWLCFACLSGLAQPYTYTEPSAKRLIVKEICDPC